MTTDGLRFEIENRQEDDTFYSSHVGRRLYPDSSLFFRSKYFYFSMLIVLAVSLLGVSGVSVALLTAFGIVMLALAIILFAFGLWRSRNLRQPVASPFWGRKLCTIDETGIAFESGNLRSWINWACVAEVEDTPQYLLIYYDLARAVIIPKASFKTPEDWQAALQAIRKYATISKIGSPGVTVPDPAPSPRHAGGFSRFGWFALLLIGISFLPLFMLPSETADPDVSMVPESVKVVDDAVIVLGHIRNPGRSDWDVNSARLVFYDKNNNLIDQCTTYLFQHVKAGQSSSFKLSCDAKSRQANTMAQVMPDTLTDFARVTIKADRGSKPSWLFPSLIGEP